MGITVQAHGCFDGLHIGHVAHLEAAKRLGDKLVVTITADEFITWKGPGRPVFPAHERAQMLRALRCVSSVLVINAPDMITAVQLVKPDIVVKGIEYKDALLEQGWMESCGIKVVFLDTKPRYSSTDLLSGKHLLGKCQNPCQALFSPG